MTSGFAVMVNGMILPDTVYSVAALSKYHFLAFNTGDYDESDFYHLPGRLDPHREFERYSEATIVSVQIRLIAH